VGGSRTARPCPEQSAVQPVRRKTGRVLQKGNHSQFDQKANEGACMRCLAVCVLGLLVGCATPYHRGGLAGGYDDFQIADNEFEITFRGNRYTPEETVKKYLLRRAAELCFINNFTHFLPCWEKDRTRIATEYSSHGSTSSYVFRYPLSLYGFSSSQGYSRPVICPAASIRIRCVSDPTPKLSSLIDARGFLEHNFPKEFPKLEASQAAPGPGATASISANPPDRGQ